ncbi:MAG: FAD-dependent monooxygenase [Myxococcota bacterium]
MSTDLDVAILGGGLAGNLLARQIARTVPGLRIALFEKSTETSWKVGESVVEIGSHYLIKRLGLSRYLYDRHLAKNGLRYFFDNETRSLPLWEMSEIGPISLPFHPSFQLDRARLEADLYEMNRKSGVDVQLGVRARPLEIGTDGAPHLLEVAGPDGTRALRTRWLVDAAGRSDLLARRLGLRVREATHRIGSVWGRFENVTDIDDIGPEPWHARVRHSTRFLSTVHFFYPGYWIWFIPLHDGITSVGVTGPTGWDERQLRTPEGFREFLDSHAAVAHLLRDAKALDIGSYAQIAYSTRRFFSPDRWGLTGEAATAADPLYSPGTDFIAHENDFLTELIRRDLAGEGGSELAERCELYDGFMKFRQEATLSLYRNLYETFGSYELGRLKWDFDIACYYNLWVSPYMRDEHLDPRWLRRQLRMAPHILHALASYNRLFQTVAESMRARGEFYRMNQGVFTPGLDHLDFLTRVGLPRPRREVLEKTEQIFNSVRRRALLMLGPDACRDPDEVLSLHALVSADSLV